MARLAALGDITVDGHLQRDASGAPALEPLVESIAFGLLYDKSLPLLVTLSVVGQLLSLPLFLLGRNSSRSAR